VPQISPRDVEARALEIYNAHDLDAYEEVYASDIEVIGFGYRFTSVEQFKEVGRLYFASMPDITLSILFETYNDDYATIHWRMAGTLAQPMFGIEPGKTIDITGAYIDHIVDGKIVQRRAFWDSTGMLVQGGLITTPW